MNSWKTLAIAVMVLSSTQAIAAENNNPFQGALMIINIDRLQYHGEAGINRLVREILEEMVISRQTSNL